MPLFFVVVGEVILIVKAKLQLHISIVQKEGVTIKVSCGINPIEQEFSIVFFTVFSDLLKGTQNQFAV